MDEQNVEGKQEQGTQAQDSVSDQLSPEASTTDFVSKDDFERVVSELRGLQSKMDKDTSKAAERIQSNLEERLKQLNIQLTPEQQLQNKILDLEEQISGRPQAQASAQPAKVVETQPQTVNIAEIKKAYPELDFNSPDVLQAVATNMNNEDALLAALGKAKLKQAGKPKPTSASVAAPTGRPANVSEVSELNMEITNLMGDRKKLLTKEGRAELKELRKKLQQAEQA